MTPAELIAAVGCTQAHADEYAAHLTEACDAFGINTPTRLAAFLAQVGHESGSLTYCAEIASGDAYEGRKDLGNTEPGDGRRFKGKGLIQLTGRGNARECAQGLAAYGCPDFEADPDALMQPRWAAMSAGWFWHAHECNELADALDFEALTRKINGGLNGYEDRKRRWERARNALSAPGAPGLAPTVTSSATPPAGPTASKGLHMPPFLIPALTAIMQAIPALQAKWGGDASAVATRNVAMVTTLVDTVKTAVGAVNEQHLIQKLADEPAAVVQAKDAVQSIWWQLDTSGMSAAREADAKFVMAKAPLRRSPSFMAMCAMLPLVYGTMGAVIGLYGNLKLDPGVQASIITGLITLIIGGSAAYYWGAMTTGNKPQPQGAPQ